MAVVEMKSFDVWTMGKVLAALGFVWGAIAGFIWATIGGTFLGAAVNGTPGGAAIGFAGFIVIWVAATTAYTVMGFVSGVLFALVYNVVAGRIGGITFKTK